MSSTFVVTLDGIIRKTGTAAALNPGGLALYRALATTGRLAILCGTDPENAEWFLRTNGLASHAYVVPESVEAAPTIAGRRRAQISFLRSQGSHIEFVIDPDPEVIAALHEDGVPGLLYLHPQFSQPSFRPDYESVAKPWDVLVEKVDYQIRMKAEQVRPEEED